MITLTGQREIAKCNVYRDDVDPLAWYVVPQSPAIALDETGKPVFSLVWYRRDVAQLSEEERKTRLGGGLLAFSVELAVSDDQMSEIRRTLAADPALAQLLERANPTEGPDYRRWWVQEINRNTSRLAVALKIGAVPVVDGTVTVAVLAESPEAGTPGEFVANLVGVGRVSMTGRERASFMAKLTQDGAVLLWEMVERQLPAIRVAYDLKFNHRLDGVRMVVWCHARKAFDALQEQWQHINDDASWSVTHHDGGTHYTFSHDENHQASSRMSRVARDSQAAGVEIIPEGGADVVPAEQIQALTQIGNDMIKDFLAATFLEFKAGEGVQFDEDPTLETALATQDGKEYGHHGIEYYKLKTWHDEMSADLDYQFRSKAVMEGHLAPNDNLSNILGGRRVEEMRTQIEIDAEWYRYLDVQVLCTADFVDDPVDLVKAHLEYHATGAQGRVDNVKDLVFRKDTPPQHFATYLAGPDKRSYDYEYEVFYRGSADRFAVRGRSDETILVLDTDRLGVLRVDVQVGLVDWTRIQSLLVKMWYGSGGARKETEFTLDAQNQSHRWSEVIAREVTEPYGYQLTFTDKNGQRIVLDPESSRARQLIVNQPLQDELEVAVVPAGSFGADGLLSKIVVALRYRDTAHDYTADDVFILTKEGDSKVWTVPLMDKTLRTYQYQVTVFYSDGVTRDDDWRTTDRPVLPVGDPFNMRVQVLPYLIKNPPYQFGTLHLAFDDDAAGIHAANDFQITDFTKPLYWRFRLGSPQRHTYRYELTLFDTEGREVRLPSAEESKEVLVLKPPQG